MSFCYDEDGMTVASPFKPVKLIVGLIYSQDEFRGRAEQELRKHYGEADARSAVFEFNFTEYYAREMGPGPLRRAFLSFRDLRSPEELPDIKLRANAIEEDIRRSQGAAGRPVNIDPGFLTQAALIMATAKDFSHRVPLREGIYAHLELLFSKLGVRTLDWTYPDFRRPECQDFFGRVRSIYLDQMKNTGKKAPTAQGTD